MFNREGTGRHEFSVEAIRMGKGKVPTNEGLEVLEKSALQSLRQGTGQVRKVVG